MCLMGLAKLPRAPRAKSETTGSEPDPRFTFANERTYLAWTRTSIALIGAGLVAAQFLKLGFRAAALVVGVTLVVLGGLMSFASYRNWQRNDRALRLGQPLPPSTMPHVLARGMVLFAVAGAALAALAFSAR